MATPRKGGLGKGLDALFVDNTTEDIAPTSLKISEIEPNPNQPRKDFDDAALGELADSIREHGILQPLVVRPTSSGRYQIVAGERRWRASRMVGLGELPVVIKELTETQAMEIALIENLQREDLGPLEEALGYQTLIDTYGMSQEHAAKRVGKSRPAVANALRLLQLPEEILAMLRKGTLSAGHARTLLALGDPKEMTELAKKAVAEGFSVRKLEQIVSKIKKGGKKPTAPVSEWGAGYYKEVALALESEIGHAVKVSGKKNGGVIEIAFTDRRELDSIVASLANLRKGI